MFNQKIIKLDSWFIEKKKLAKLYFDNRRRSKLICKMGDIYFTKIGVNIGSEIDKHRPVLVFQGNDFYLRNSDSVFIFPLTSKTKQRKFQVIFQKEDVVGNLKDGCILISQGKVISKIRLVKKLGKLNHNKLKEVKNVFEKFLYKNTPLQSERSQGDAQTILKKNP